MPECQKQWKKLRDCYKKALRLRQYKSGSARKTEKPIKFEKELEFLKPHLPDRSQTSNLDCSDNSLDVDTEDISIIESQTSDVGKSSRSDSALSNHSIRNKTLPLSLKLFRQYVEAKGKEEDPLDAFFLSMSKSVKKMPIRIQAELKRAILSLVTDAEVKLASEESIDTPSSMINCYGTQQQQIYSSPSTSIPPTTCPPPTSTTPPHHTNYGTISNTTASSAPISPYIPQPISRTQQQRQSKFDEFEEFTYNE